MPLPRRRFMSGQIRRKWPGGLPTDGMSVGLSRNGIAPPLAEDMSAKNRETSPESRIRLVFAALPGKIGNGGAFIHEKMADLLQKRLDVDLCRCGFCGADFVRFRLNRPSDEYIMCFQTEAKLPRAIRHHGRGGSFSFHPHARLTPPFGFLFLRFDTISRADSR